MTGTTDITIFQNLTKPATTDAAVRELAISACGAYLTSLECSGIVWLHPSMVSAAKLARLVAARRHSPMLVGKTALDACELLHDAYWARGYQGADADLDDAAEYAEATLVMAGRRSRRMSEDLLWQIAGHAA